MGITSTVEHKKFFDGADAWIERITEDTWDRNAVSGMHKEMRAAGYDITEAAKELEQRYIDEMTISQ